MERAEAIEVVRKNWPSEAFTMLREALETLIPELHKSEDERIRKELIDHCIQGSKQRTIVSHKEDYKRWLSWLEKQKPIDNTIKGGDIVIDKYGRVFLVLANVSERNYKEEYSTYCESLLLGVDGCVYSNGTDLEGYKNANEEDRTKFLHDLKVITRISGKPAEWSEEDERIIDTIVSVLSQYIDYKAVSGTGSGYVTPRYSKEIDWLKSLSERFNLEPKQEWSEEDERILNELLDHCNTENATWYNFLKSLRPSWKPSEGQMKALFEAMQETRPGWLFNRQLVSLYDDLKKL